LSRRTWQTVQVLGDTLTSLPMLAALGTATTALSLKFVGALVHAPTLVTLADGLTMLAVSSAALSYRWQQSQGERLKNRFLTVCRNVGPAIQTRRGRLIPQVVEIREEDNGICHLYTVPPAGLAFSDYVKLTEEFEQALGGGVKVRKRGREIILTIVPGELPVRKGFRVRDANEDNAGDRVD